MDKIEVFIDQQKFEIEIKSSLRASSTIEICVNGKMHSVSAPDWSLNPEDWHWFEIDGKSFELDIDPELRWIRSVDGLHRVEPGKLDDTPVRPASGDGRVRAPIPGLITKVFVEGGQRVKRGDPLLILEAMKMENEISAPREGLVRKLAACAGKTMTLGEVMVEIE
jgi:acetyl/propionyl-CoA carboxylase alpha subunit